MKKRWLSLILAIGLILPIARSPVNHTAFAPTIANAAEGFVDPNGDGVTTEWTPTPAGTHYTTQDDGIWQPTEPNVADYISADAEGTFTDIFDMSTLPSVASVSNVTIWGYLAAQGGTTITGSVYMGGSWRPVQDFTVTTIGWYSLSFDGNWTQADLNALQVKVIATISASAVATDSYAMYGVVTYTATSTNVIAKLTYPKGGGNTTRMYLPGSPRGIVANGTAAVDFHQIDLYDTVTGDTMTIFPQVKGRNKSTETRLFASKLYKRGSPGISSQYPLVQSDTYVKATSKYNTSHWPYFSTDPAKSLIGPEWDGRNWVSANTVTTNQRFHIDLLTTKIVTRIYYENSHNSGTGTNVGVRNFIFQGSNVSTAFDNTTYDSNGDWDNLTTDTTVMARHVDANTPDPKFINVTNSTAYKYYAFKFADNYGNVSYMGVRRIELQTDFQVKFGRKYIMTLRAMDVTGAQATDFGFVYFLPRSDE